MFICVVEDTVFIVTKVECLGIQQFCVIVWLQTKFQFLIHLWCSEHHHTLTHVFTNWNTAQHLTEGGKTQLIKHVINVCDHLRGIVFVSHLVSQWKCVEISCLWWKTLKRHLHMDRGRTSGTWKTESLKDKRKEKSREWVQIIIFLSNL